MADKKSIDNVENKLKEYYRDIQDLEVPKELEEKLLLSTKGIKPKKKKWKNGGLLAASIILVCVITTWTFYPAIADTILNLLKFKDSISEHDAGAKKVFEAELGKEVYIQSSNPNMTIVLQRAYRDKNRIIFFATVHYDKSEKTGEKVFEGILNDENEKSLSAFCRSEGYDENTNSALIKFQFDKDIEKLGQQLTLKIEESDIFSSDGKKEVGDSHAFSLDSLDTNEESIVVDINKEVSMSDIKVHFKKIEATPSEMRIYYEYDIKFYKSEILGTKDVEDLRFSLKSLIIDGKKYSALYGSGESVALDSEDKERMIGFTAFNPFENLANLHKIQNVTLKIENIYRTIPVEQLIPLEKNDEAYYMGTDGKKYKISIQSVEIKDEGLVVLCKFDERMLIFFSGVLEGDNVYRDRRMTRVDEDLTEADIKNNMVAFRLIFDRPPKLTGLKLIVQEAEGMVHKNLDVKLK